MEKQDNKNKTPGKLIGLAIVLLITAPEVVIPVGIFAGICYLVIRAMKNGQNPPRTPAQRPAVEIPARAEHDRCPRTLFCFHKDKGEHHVVRGREIDPWDRPDIDISKYQRKQ